MKIKHLFIYLFIYSLFITIGCKKEERKTGNYGDIGLNSNRIYNFTASEIEIFIDSINSAFINQYSTVEIDPDSAQDLMEEALNFSFSDVDTALTNIDTSTYNLTFSIELNGNNKFDFLELANSAKYLANHIKGISFNSNVRFQFCRIDKTDEFGNFEIVISAGELDAEFNYSSFPTASAISGNYLWRVDPYEIYSYIPCSTNDPYAPIKLRDEINKYLRNVATYRTRDIALAAPFGYEVYYSSMQKVWVDGYDVFNYEDFVNLSKFDFPTGILSFEDSQCHKSGVPFKAPIYAADPDEVACFVLFNSATYGFKSCINAVGMNYYLTKSLDIYDVLRPTNLSILFDYMTIEAHQPIFSGDPIEHKYRFFTKNAKIRPVGGYTL